MSVSAPGSHALLPPGVEDSPGVSDQHHHLQVLQPLQQMCGLSHSQPHRLHETERKERTGGGEIVTTETDGLSWLEALTGGPQQGVATPQQEGVLLLDDVIQESLILLGEITLKDQTLALTLTGNAGIFFTSNKLETKSTRGWTVALSLSLM